ncbi:MAG TPA: 50S ribosomal protein L30 [Thermoleophilaceae bacterium]
MAETIRLTQVKSPNGSNERQKGTLRTLGLGKIGATAERPDDPTVRGAIQKVAHLVKVED